MSKHWSYIDAINVLVYPTNGLTVECFDLFSNYNPIHLINMSQAFLTILQQI